ncbi:MAG: ATP12 family chaperone protein [Alphaproteobacteria bacterium]
MKRFYKTTGVEEVEGGFCVKLDTRALPAPSKVAMTLPTLALAEAIAGEWEAQGEKIDAATMPFMAFAATVVDKIMPNLDHVHETIITYGGTDLLSYWAEAPERLIKLQYDAWNKHLEWTKSRFSPGLITTAGIVPVAQPDETLEAFAKAIVSMNPWQLGGVVELTQVTGSLVLGIAHLEGEASIDELIDCATVDERFQEERWGEDDEALAIRAKKEQDMRNAAAYLALLT